MVINRFGNHTGEETHNLRKTSRFTNNDDNNNNNNNNNNNVIIDNFIKKKLLKSYLQLIRLKKRKNYSFKNTIYNFCRFKKHLI